MGQRQVNSYLWSRVPPSVGHAMGRIERRPAGWDAAGIEVSGDEGRPMSCMFEVQLDLDWHTVAVRVTTWSDLRRQVQLNVQPGGHWWQDGDPRADLDGCVDVDVSATPLTNTFPLRRLDSLACGESTTLPVAWIDVPTLRVHRLAQTYKRLTQADGANVATWEYSDPRHGAFVLGVDAEGVVVDYENFATRLS